jgi:hexulose-6-phosphate isomerase
MTNALKFGFVQGRLSPIIDGKIQIFPAPYWREEFPQAEKLGFALIEWTLDQDGLRENPFNTPAGQTEIRALSARHGVIVSSVSGDCFMHAPFYKASGASRAELIEDLHLILDSAAKLALRHVLIPLVDNGRLDNRQQEDELIAVLLGLQPQLERNGLRILFESDFRPTELARFIDRLPAANFGINYDIGNSASLGYRPAEELEAYGHRVIAVHVKDRLLGGTTVPLGTGDADLPGAFRALAHAGYAGDYVLQTARAADGNHAEALCRYRDMVLGWLSKAGTPKASGP